jgi:hypothetical protein
MSETGTALSKAVSSASYLALITSFTSISIKVFDFAN